MKPDEMMELLGLLVRELIQAAALNHYYASLMTTQPRAWHDLSEMERDAFEDAALKQAQTVFALLGWGMDIEYLKEMAKA
jgi:hypothetical protein